MRKKGVGKTGAARTRIEERRALKTRAKETNVGKKRAAKKKNRREKIGTGYSRSWERSIIRNRIGKARAGKPRVREKRDGEKNKNSICERKKIEQEALLDQEVLNGEEKVTSETSKHRVQVDSKAAVDN